LEKGLDALTPILSTSWIISILMSICQLPIKYILSLLPIFKQYVSGFFFLIGLNTIFSHADIPSPVHYEPSFTTTSPTLSPDNSVLSPIPGISSFLPPNSLVFNQFEYSNIIWCKKQFHCDSKKKRKSTQLHNISPEQKAIKKEVLWNTLGVASESNAVEGWCWDQLIGGMVSENHAVGGRRQGSTQKEWCRGTTQYEGLNFFVGGDVLFFPFPSPTKGNCFNPVWPEFGSTFTKQDFYFTPTNHSSLVDQKRRLFGCDSIVNRCAS